MRSSLWIAIIAVAAASFALKAAGPALLGQQKLPVRVNRAISLLAPVLLTALVITDVAGERWNGLSWPILIGLAATAISRLLKAPSLVAVIIGMFVTAGFRFIA
jgi:branched-subunit amino acid transport protein